MSDDRPAITSTSLGGLISRLVRSVEAVLPKDFRGKIQFGQIDKGRVERGTVSVEYRDSSPKAGMEERTK